VRTLGKTLYYDITIASLLVHGVRGNRETVETVSKDCLQWLWRHKSKLSPVWTFLQFVL